MFTGLNRLDSFKITEGLCKLKNAPTLYLNSYDFHIFGN